MPKKFLRSGLVNRPLPSAMFAAMEGDARLIQLVGKKAVTSRELFREPHT